MTTYEEQLGTTHTYIARAWYRDTAVWTHIASAIVLMLQETAVRDVIPQRYHPLTIAIIAVLNIIVRFQSSTRPVAMKEGTERQVFSIPPREKV